MIYANVPTLFIAQYSMHIVHQLNGGWGKWQFNLLIFA